MDYSLSGSSVHGIFQARVLEWVAIAFSLIPLLTTLTLICFPGSSSGKKSTCHAGDPGLTPGFGRSPGKGIGYSLQYSWASLGDSVGKKSACNIGDLGSIPGLGKSPGEGNDNPFP